MTTIYDPKRGEEALERLQPRLEAVDESRLESRISANLQGVAIHALSVADYCSQPDVFQRFQALEPSGFDAGSVPDLADLGWAAWHVKVRLMSALARTNAETVPAELIERASERKRRMLRVAVYYLEDHEHAGPELEAIQSGTGHRDLATDLVRLTTLYHEYESVLSEDTRSYRADDADAAGEEAAEILRHLGDAGSSAAMWLDRQRRVWALLRETYDEVAAGGRFLFRHDNAKQRFGSLLAAGRRTPTRRKADEAPETPETPEAPAAE
jgi:hypothetical protein